MEKITTLIVSLSLGKKEIQVGELVSNQQKILFKYYPDFLKTNLQGVVKNWKRYAKRYKVSKTSMEWIGDTLSK